MYEMHTDQLPRHHQNKHFSLEALFVAQRRRQGFAVKKTFLSFQVGLLSGENPESKLLFCEH